MEQRRDVGAVLALTFVSGCVDAISFLGLGGVFVANMTGNVAIVGFAVTNADGEHGLRAGLSLLCFAVGALAGGRLSPPLPAGTPWTGSVNRLLAVEVVLITAAAIVVAAAGARADAEGVGEYGVIAVLSVAMGLQGAAARRLAVTDIPTTVVTSALTALMVDSRLAGGAGVRWQRRAAAVGALLAGATAGGLLATRLPLYSAAALAALVTGGVLVAGLLRTRGLRRGLAAEGAAPTRRG